MKEIKDEIILAMLPPMIDSCSPFEAMAHFSKATDVPLVSFREPEQPKEPTIILPPVINIPTIIKSGKESRRMRREMEREEKKRKNKTRLK